MLTRLLITTALASAAFFTAAQDNPDVQNNNQANIRDSERRAINEVLDKTQRMMFGELDANGNGFVSAEEAVGSKALLRDFDSLDDDGNNGLSPEEISDWKAMETIEKAR